MGAFELKVASKACLMVEGKASRQFKSGAYTLVREHFKLARNAAIGHQAGLRSHFYSKTLRNSSIVF